ncbi:MAG TPA: hypothetical protein ENK25_02630 [Bacteroidetes bacterium]|nr:hypothetical protein [Bacteroidota bacterium]
MKTLFLLLSLFSFFLSFPEKGLSNNMPSVQLDTVYYIPGKIKHTARMFSDMENVSSVVLYIPADSTVQILQPVKDYFLIHYQGIDGYILQKKVENYTEILKEFNQPATDRQARQNQVNDSRYRQMVSKYGNEIGEKIFEHKIWKGMTTSMVRDSWGTPRTINHYIHINRVKEEWIYPKYILVFWDNRLTSWYKRK